MGYRITKGRRYTHRLALLDEPLAEEHGLKPESKSTQQNDEDGNADGNQNDDDVSSNDN